MSLVLLVSIIVHLAAVGWSVWVLKRHRDWRMGFLTAMLILMSLRHIPTLLQLENIWPIWFLGHLEEFPALLVGVMAFLAVFYLDRLLSGHKRAESEASIRLKELNLLHEASDAFSYMPTMKEVGEKILDTLDQSLHWRRGSIWLIDESTNNLELLAHSHMGLSTDDHGLELRRVQEIVSTPGKSISDWVARHGQSIRSGDVQKEPRYLEADPSIKSEMCVPLMVAGRLIGSLNVESEKLGAFSDSDEQLLSTFAAQAAAAIDNARLLENLQKELAERKRTEEALRESEKRFRRIAENVPDIVYRYLIVPEPGFEYISSAVTAIVGYTPEEHYADPELGLRIIHPDDRPSLLNLLEGRRQAIPHIVRWIRKDGAVIWIEDRHTPIYDDHGKMIGIEGVARDITEHKWAEDALRESRERLLKAQHVARMGFLDWDLNTNEISLSDEIYRLYGFKKGEIKTTPELLARSVHPDDVEYVRNNLDSAVRGVQPYDIEHRIVRPDGTIIWVHSQAELSYDADGKAKSLLGTSVDITDRKRAEEVLLDQHAELEHLYATTPVGLALVDRELKFVRINDRLAEINGRPVAEHLGRTLRQVFQRLADYLEPVFRGVLESGQPQLNVEVRGTTHADPFIERDWLASCYPVEGTKGTLYVGVIVEDVTERKEADRALHASREQLRALAAHIQSVREEERATMAREIHDELGQALTGFKMDISWLKGQVRKSLKGDNATTLTKKIDGMRGLIDGTIKTVRRISTELRPGALDDLGLVAAIEWQANEFTSRSGIACKVDSAWGDVSLDGDRTTAIFRIFQETLTNVSRHAKAKKVLVRVGNDNGKLTLEVIDDGRGISEKEIADPKSLGLLGMRERAYLIGGELFVEPGEKKGTRVLLRVPVAQQ